MLRKLVLRSTRPVIYHRLPVTSRALTTTTTPPPSSKGHSGTNKRMFYRPEGNNAIITISALGALGVMYYYYTRGQPAIDRETVKRKEEEMEKRLKDLGEIGKSRVEGVAKMGQRDYDQAKVTVQDARARATEAGADLAERARQSAYEAQAKFGDFKNTAERKIGDVRDRSEGTLEEDKEEVARQVRKTENKARGWFGLGSSK